MRYIVDHDLHLHSQLSLCSGHPQQTGENILKYAKEMGFRHICLTDHFWDDNVPGAMDWYKRQNYDHIAMALPLPEDEEVRFDFGCETDFDKHMTLGVSREVMDKFDFIIVPTSHLHMHGFTIEPDVVTVEDRASFYMERNHALLDMDLPFEKMGLAHFTCDLMASGCEGSRDDILNAISDVQLAELFERVAKKGMGVELNTPVSDCHCEAALRPYKIALQCGCKFYFGSDAHNPKGLEDSRRHFEAMAEVLDLKEDHKFPYAAKFR